MVKALARGFRWREMLEAGAHSTIKELAAAERIAETYVGRVLRMSLLAPDIVESILAGKQPPETTLYTWMKAFPVDWDSQREMRERVGASE